MSKGNVTEEIRILNDMVRQEKINQERIKATNGAILNPDIFSEDSNLSNPVIDSYFPMWIGDIDPSNISPNFTDIVTGEVVGNVTQGENLEGYTDDNFAHFWTNGWEQDYSDPDNPQGGEACVNGPLTETAFSGDVYISAKVGPLSSNPGWDEGGYYAWMNRVIVWVYNGYNGYPCYVGNVLVDSDVKTGYYVGWAQVGYGFDWIAISCWTPPWWPDDYSPHEYNSVEIDTAMVWGWMP